MMNLSRSLPPRVARGVALVVALLLVTSALGVLSPRADALPACGTHYKYYSDCTYTTQVGYEYYDCNGVLQYYSGMVTSCYTVARYCCPIDP